MRRAVAAGCPTTDHSTGRPVRRASSRASAPGKPSSWVSTPQPAAVDSPRTATRSGGAAASRCSGDGLRRRWPGLRPAGPFPLWRVPRSPRPLRLASAVGSQHHPLLDRADSRLAAGSAARATFSPDHGPPMLPSIKPRSRTASCSAGGGAGVRSTACIPRGGGAVWQCVAGLRTVGLPCQVPVAPRRGVRAERVVRGRSSALAWWRC